jgi:hypothetical protein
MGLTAVLENEAGEQLERVEDPTNVRRTKDFRLTQRFARHKSILTTSIYAHSSDEDLVRAVRELPC